MEAIGVSVVLKKLEKERGRGEQGKEVVSGGGGAAEASSALPPAGSRRLQSLAAAHERITRRSAQVLINVSVGGRRRVVGLGHLHLF